MGMRHLAREIGAGYTRNRMMVNYTQMHVYSSNRSAASEDSLRSNLKSAVKPHKLGGTSVPRERA
jgi:hypothetical protein